MCQKKQANRTKSCLKVSEQTMIKHASFSEKQHPHCARSRRLHSLVICALLKVHSRHLCSHTCRCLHRGRVCQTNRQAAITAQQALLTAAFLPKIYTDSRNSDGRLPHSTLLLGVHGSSSFTMKRFGKSLKVLKGTENPVKKQNNMALNLNPFKMCFNHT